MLYFEFLFQFSCVWSYIQPISLAANPHVSQRTEFPLLWFFTGNSWATFPGLVGRMGSCRLQITQITTGAYFDCQLLLHQDTFLYCFTVCCSRFFPCSAYPANCLVWTSCIFTVKIYAFSNSGKKKNHSLRLITTVLNGRNSLIFSFLNCI